MPVQSSGHTLAGERFNLPRHVCKRSDCPYIRHFLILEIQEISVRKLCSIKIRENHSPTQKQASGHKPTQAQRTTFIN